MEEFIRSAYAANIANAFAYDDSWGCRVKHETFFSEEHAYVRAVNHGFDESDQLNYTHVIVSVKFYSKEDSEFSYAIEGNSLSKVTLIFDTQDAFHEFMRDLMEYSFKNQDMKV